jgi:hypothetical protein
MGKAGMLGTAGIKTTARTTTQHPPPLLRATACRVDGGGARTRTRTGIGTGTEHTMHRGKTDNKDRTMETFKYCARLKSDQSPAGSDRVRQKGLGFNL